MPTKPIPSSRAREAMDSIRDSFPITYGQWLHVNITMQPISVTRSERLQLSGPSELALGKLNGDAASPGSKPRLMDYEGRVDRLNFTFKACRIQIRSQGCLHPEHRHHRLLRIALDSGTSHIVLELPRAR